MSEINHGAVGALIKVLAAATHDKDNALGSGKTPMFLESYGTLFIDMLRASGNVGNLSTTLRLLSQEDSGPIVSQLTHELGITSLHAQAIIDVGTRVLQQFINATISAVECMAAAIKDADAAKALAQAKQQK